MSKQQKLMWLSSRTGVHCGSGSSLEVIDLPIQRERATGFPIFQASSLKGALRSAFTDKVNEKALFGPEQKVAADHAAAVSFTDARVLFFPVRSFRGVFAAITCPLVLERFSRDTGTPLDLSKCAPKDNEIIASSGLVFGGKVVLEEYVLDVSNGDPNQISALLPPAYKSNAPRLAVVHDDTFKHFVTTATEVTARIAINKETRIVKDGALWYEESLPSETLLYSMAFAVDSRDGAKLPAANVIGLLEKGLPAVFQIGGNETIGKGLVALEWRA